LGLIHKRVANFKLDEEYIGTPEEREEAGTPDGKSLKAPKGDSVAEAHLGTNVLQLPPGSSKIPSEWSSQRFKVMKTFSDRRADILNNITDLRDQIVKAATPEESKVFERALALEIAALESLNKEQVEENDLESSHSVNHKTGTV